MKTNLVPSLIIAAAILGTGYLVSRNSASRVEGFFSELEEVTRTKDDEGRTQVGRIVEGFSSTVAESFKAGFSGGQNEEDKAELAVIDKLVMKDVTIVPGSHKGEERVIGVLRNESTETIADVNLSVVFNGQNGRLVDVSTRFARVEGALKPGHERGFAVERESGDSDEKDEVLNARKASIAAVSVTGLRIIR